MKLIRATVVLMMVPLMVLSTGGFNIFTHWCHETGDKLVSFQAPESCSHEQGEHHEDCSSACCSHMENEHSCCENDHVYIRTVENVSNDNDRTFFDVDLAAGHYLANLVFSESVALVADEYLFCDYTAPPCHSAKFIVVKYGRLKLDCCTI